jgi:hypothetical protein
MWAMPVTLLLLFRLVSTMPSSRWYKGLNCKILQDTKRLWVMPVTLIGGTKNLTAIYCIDNFPPCHLHEGTNGLTSQHSGAIRPLLHTLLCHFFQKKLLFRLVSTMPSSRWYKGLNCNNLHVTHTPVGHAGHINRWYEGPNC